MGKKPLPIVLPAILEQALKEECRNTRIPEYRTILLILTEYFRNYIIANLGLPAYNKMIEQYSKTIDEEVTEMYQQIGLNPPANNNKQENKES